MDLIVNGQSIKGSDNEVWIYAYNTYYFSSTGRLATSNHRNTGKLKLMKPAKDANGYLRTMLVIDGKNKTIKMHREICKLFHPNPNYLPVVNHKNFDRSDNNISNLEWTTWKGNAIHSAKEGRLNTWKKGEKQHINCIKRGEDNGLSILTEQDVLEIRQKFKARVYTRAMLAVEYGVKPTTIKDVVLRKSWRHV